MRRKVYLLYVRREGGPPAGVRTKFKRYCCTFRLELLLFAGSTNEYNSPVFRTLVRFPTAAAVDFSRTYVLLPFRVIINNSRAQRLASKIERVDTQIVTQHIQGLRMGAWVPARTYTPDRK